MLLCPGLEQNYTVLLYLFVRLRGTIGVQDLLLCLFYNPMLRLVDTEQKQSALFDFPYHTGG